MLQQQPAFGPSRRHLQPSRPPEDKRLAMPR